MSSQAYGESNIMTRSYNQLAMNNRHLAVTAAGSVVLLMGWIGCNRSDTPTATTSPAAAVAEDNSAAAPDATAANTPIANASNHARSTANEVPLGPDAKVQGFRELFRGTELVWKEYQGVMGKDGRPVKHGTHREFYDDGKTLRETGHFANGKRTGDWELYHRNGKLAKKGQYGESKLEGLWHVYNEDGALMREEAYKSGKKNGVWKFFASDGKQMLREQAYKDGEKHGMWRQWYDNGQLSHEIPYVEGLVEGTQKIWFRSGQQQSEVEYLGGKIHGNATSWNEQGNLADQKTFREGIQISQ